MNLKNTVMAVLLSLALTAALAGCAKTNNQAGGTNNAGGSQSQEPEPSESSESSQVRQVSLNDILAAIREAYGENYLPSEEIPPEVLETEFGLTPDMYVEAKGEMSMISTHPDRVVVVRADPGQADNVEAALNKAKESKINDEMQYPANVPKTNATQVVRSGDYVAFLLVGAPMGNVEASEEQLAEHFRGETQKGAEAFNELFE